MAYDRLDDNDDDEEEDQLATRRKTESLRILPWRFAVERSGRQRSVGGLDEKRVARFSSMAPSPAKSDDLP